MVSKQFSFRLPDEAVEALEALQIEGETLNQTAQRRMLECLGLSTDLSTKVNTSVDIEELVKRQVDQAITDSQLLKDMVQLNSSYLAMGIDKIERELRSQLEELRGKSKAR